MLDINAEILAITGASQILQTQHVQTLWSGYGEIKRYALAGRKHNSIIVKHIQLPDQSNHPRGWNTQLSRQRKLTSYQVERKWYQQYSTRTNEHCKVPECYHAAEKESELLLIMEDLDASGYPIRLNPEEVTIAHAKNCLGWLAHFHATYLGTAPDGLWPIGTYWHLDTRPDELERMENISLKNAAKGIDKRLNNTKYQTIVHGDAKLANFCFAEDGRVAAVDFQYVGKGCGMKDVAYFISSCFDEEDCEKYEKDLLEYYFNQLQLSLDNYTVYQQVKNEWSDLYRYAWADFYRFLDGWSPGHWKMNDYSKNITQRVIDELK
ncbi:phosphotransferase [Fulvivirga lutimaris]|uniref:phosphotransferase n=1 Tax=Fulvivirga lutimaris TaxID=1819566 RepID=UPI0012BC1625|nr:phosphotransferase [Fulvivirga lutimaris]MTI39543.1 DUF1679 domain-containing protein [Fulvivirga lutimaris]